MSPLDSSAKFGPKHAPGLGKNDHIVHSIQTFLSMENDGDDTQPKGASIQDLPVELLILIFANCHANFKLEQDLHPQTSDPPWHFLSGSLTKDMKPTSDLDRFRDLRSQARFPSALAGVSQFWSDILSLTPVYWSELIFYLDSKSNALEDFAARLSWSANLPIDIIILGRAYKPSFSYGLSRETQQLSLAMELLSPHVHRCRSILVETRLASSLSVVQDTIFQQDSNELLSSVCLMSGFADAKFSVATRCMPALRTIPSLKSLAICGRDFYNLHGDWLPLQANLQQLVISDCHLSNLNFEYVLEAIEGLENLENLKFKNVYFKANQFMVSSSIMINIFALHLEDVASATIQELFRLCVFDELESLHFTRCTVDRFPSCEFLVLEDIQSIPNSPLELTLGDWDGLSLWIGNYRGFTDSFLDAFRRIDGYTSEFKCPWMENLYLYGLPAVSVKKLKKLIKRRNQSVDYDDPEWRNKEYDGPVISKLSIERCTIVELTLEDMEWFRSRLLEFIYIP